MILVFGAAGFIGAYLCDRLLQNGCEIVASDVSEIGEAYYRRRSTQYCRVDITRKSDFDLLPRHGVQAVVHLACAQPANMSAALGDGPEEYMSVNALGTLNILEFCRATSVPKIIYACSHRNTQGMWAQKAGRPILESDGRSIMFTGEYAMFSISESAATDCVEHYSQAFGIEGIVMRLPPVYGYGPHTEGFRHGMPQETGFQVFVNNARRSRPLEVWGDPTNGRDIVYVKDVVAAIELALHSHGVHGLFNIASGHRLTLQEQAETIVSVFSPQDRPSEIRYLPGRSNDIESYVYSIAKARDALGWRPEYSFRDMLIDYRTEMDSGRFAFLVEKRRQMMEAFERGH